MATHFSTVGIYFGLVGPFKRKTHRGHGLPSPPKQKLHNGCHKITKKEVKVAAAAPAPEIFFRIYILIQSGFSLYCRVLILQWCPKKFVGKEKKFQGFHYCQKVDKKGREIYTQFSNNSLHALIWPNWLSTLKNTRGFDKTDLVSHSLEKSQFCKTSSKSFFPWSNREIQQTRRT